MAVLEYHLLSLSELAHRLQRRELRSVELTDYFLQRIEKIDGSLNSFLTVFPDLARQQAEEADRRLDRHEHVTPLTGIPYGLKDYISTQGLRTTAGSKILDQFKPMYDATVVVKLREAGAVLVGKNNLDEFGMGSSTENSALATTKNPWDHTRVPGGSSGGSAAAVAAGLVPFSVGADTGGSIRMPAAFCGITGLKPTYGRVSRYGLFALASSFDTIGPLARSAQDCAEILQVLAGYDPYDNTSQDKPVPSYRDCLHQRDSLQGLKIGLPKEYFIEGLEPEVRQCLERALEQMVDLGAETVTVSLPHTEYAIPVYYLILFAEASANLARYDGIRFGSTPLEAKSLAEIFFQTRGAGFGKEVKRRIMLGTHALSTGFYEAYYLRAQKVRTLIRRDFENAFSQCDLIVTPVTPTPAFRLGEKTADPLSMYLSDIFTVSVNPAGIPGLSVPCGLVQGLPVGMQLLAPHFSEDKLLSVAHCYQQATDAHLQRPRIG